MKILKAFVVLAALGILGAVALWLEHRSGVTLPAPTGPFAVGRSIYDWTGDKRELLVWIWYPAAARPGAAMDEYVPSWRATGQRAYPIPLIFRLLTHDVSKVHGHVTRNAEVSPRQRSYPVAIMRAGASSEVMNYSALAEDLASNGYVVVGFDAPYRTRLVVFPDGRTIARTPENDAELYSGAELERVGNKLLAAWTGDIAFVLDRLERLNAADASGKFTGRLNMARVGVFGHSFGGATAAQFCHEDARCKAGIDVDGSLHGSVIQTGIARPFMFLMSDHSHESDPESSQILANIQAVYDRLPADGRRWVAIRGANHFTFSDDGALLKSSVMRGVLRLFGGLRIDGRRQIAVTAYCVRSFFDAYLKGTGAGLLDTQLYPEIEILGAPREQR